MWCFFIWVKWNTLSCNLDTLSVMDLGSLAILGSGLKVGCPPQPTLTGSQQAFPHSLKHSATTDTYLTHVLSCASSILSSPEAFNSSTCLVASDIKTISCRSVVAAMVSRTFSCLPRSTRTCQSYAIKSSSLWAFSQDRGFSPKQTKKNGALCLVLPLAGGDTGADGICYRPQYLVVTPTVLPLSHSLWTAAKNELQQTPSSLRVGKQVSPPGPR